MSMKICGLSAYCRCASRRFRNALLFIAVENNRKGAARAAWAAWSHVLFSVENTEPGEPFDLDHLALTARDRAGSGLRQS
jgi:hypothetical protein